MLTGRRLRRLAISAMAGSAVALAAVLWPGPGTAEAQSTPSVSFSTSYNPSGVRVTNFTRYTGYDNEIDVEVCAVTETGALDASDCHTSILDMPDSGSEAFPDLRTNRLWGESGPRPSRYFRVRTFHYRSSDGATRESSWGEVRFHAANYACDAVNSPRIDLGTLGTAGGATLTRSGVLDGTYYGSACQSPEDGWNAAVFFRVDLDQPGAIRVENPRGQSTMVPELYIRAGSVYSGTELFQDYYNQARDDALAAGLLAAGEYTIELRAYDQMSSANPSAAGGAYNLTVTRLQPELAVAVPKATVIDTVWNVGAHVAASRHGTADNRIDLSIQTGRRLASASSWTETSASASPPDGSSLVEDTIGSLELGSAYRVRAAFTNAAQWTESEDIVTQAFIRLSGAPYRVEAVGTLLDAGARRWQVRVGWETPSITAGDNLTWRYASRLNQGTAMFNPAGQEQALETTFDYTSPAGDVLEIEVNNTFACPQPAAGEASPWTECSLTYDGRDFTIPAGDSWSTPWSSPGLVHLAAPAGTVAGRVTERSADPAVAGAINLVMDLAGEPEEGRRVEPLAVVLGVLAAVVLGGGVGYYAGGGAPMRVALGTGVTLTTLTGLGTYLFGVPDELIIVAGAALVLLGALALIRRFAL